MEHRSSDYPYLHRLVSNEDGNRKKFKKRKRRRTNEKMKNIINTIEKEIETQLDVKNEKNDFTTTDTKAILKEVIMDEEIKEMIRQTLRLPNGTESPYEPKLTRAKIRELLKFRPDLSFPILWPISAKKSDFVSECLSLINENYTENSSEDEEYKPEEEKRGESGEGSSNFNITLEGNSSKANDAASYSDSLSQPNQRLLTGNDEGNIGQRTRSKLPLIDTPLEVIEQGLVPPDITNDMYDFDHDNEDWSNFIVALGKPLDSKRYDPTDLDDDADDDPEYNILADEETVDKEELRKDRGVEVPQKEVVDLIAELIKDCEPINSIAEAPKLVDNITHEIHLNANDNSTQMTPAPDLDEIQENIVPVDITCASKSDLPVILPSQRHLLDQQMRQHVQMTTMHFLQFHKHPYFHRYANTMKELIISIKNLSGNNRSSPFYTLNLDSSLQIIQEWEKLRINEPEPKLNIFDRKWTKKIENFPRDLMKVATKSDAFLYPLLLPHVPFNSVLTTHKKELMDSEEWLLSVGLEEFMDYVKRNFNSKNEDDVLKEAIKLINHYLLPCFPDRLLRKHVKKRRAEPAPNYIKEYFERKKAPPLRHYVVPVISQPLFKQPLDLMPEVWATYIQNNYVFVRLKK